MSTSEDIVTSDEVIHLQEDILALRTTTEELESELINRRNNFLALPQSKQISLKLEFDNWKSKQELQIKLNKQKDITKRQQLKDIVGNRYTVHRSGKLTKN